MKQIENNNEYLKPIFEKEETYKYIDETITLYLGLLNQTIKNGNQEMAINMLDGLTRFYNAVINEQEPME